MASAKIKATRDGFIGEIEVASGGMVEAGALIASMASERGVALSQCEFSRKLLEFQLSRITGDEYKLRGEVLRDAVAQHGRFVDYARRHAIVVADQIAVGWEFRQAQLEADSLLAQEIKDLEGARYALANWLERTAALKGQIEAALEGLTTWKNRIVDQDANDRIEAPTAGAVHWWLRSGAYAQAGDVIAEVR